MAVRYESRAYGTREEIADVIKQGMTGHRSERKKEQLSEALEALREGADSVTIGPTTYFVTED